MKSILILIILVLQTSCSNQTKLTNLEKEFEYHKGTYLASYLKTTGKENLNEMFPNEVAEAVKTSQQKLNFDMTNLEGLITKRLGSDTVLHDTYQNKTRDITVTSLAENLVCITDINDDGIIDKLTFAVVDPKDRTNLTTFVDENADGQWDYKLILKERKVFKWVNNNWVLKEEIKR